MPVNATTANTVRVSTAQPGARSSSTGSMFSRDDVQTRNLQSAETGLSGLTRPVSNFSIPRPQTCSGKTTTIRLLRENMGIASKTRSAEHYEDFYGVQDVPFPDEEEQETPFFKSLTAEYLSTIQPKQEWWSTRRGLRKTLHPNIPNS